MNDKERYAYNKRNNTLGNKTRKHNTDMERRARKYRNASSRVYITDMPNDMPNDNIHLNYNTINDINKLNELLKNNEKKMKDEAIAYNTKIKEIKKGLKDTRKINFSQKIRNGITNLENKLNSIKSSILNLTRKNKKNISHKNDYNNI